MNSLTLDQRFLVSGNEAGTAPDDRRFRPDVEGLRAVAVLLVVFYHAGFPGVTGGYIGVDVFFVISGFVITGVLLRERRGTGGNSLVDFYARRVRRILPAATFVILATVAASYAALGFVSGNSVANDGRWAAVFLSNLHFEAVGTNYFTAKLPPSPLQNYWSLSVEEQFYVLYPSLFLLIASVKGRLSFHSKMVIALTAVIAGSFWLSVTQTATQPTAAYFSPFARAWELALGALVAIATPWLRRLPAPVATALTWVGLAAIAVSALVFTPETPYPGSLVAIPVVGAALLIAGGVVVPRWGSELLLRLKPFQWFGKRSYSLYLWHWPILIIAAEQAGKSSLPFRDTFVLVLIAIAVSSVSYRLIENPIRHWKLPSRTTVAAGLAMVVGTVAVLSLTISIESAPNATARLVVAPNVESVVQQVAAARSIQTVPATIVPALSNASTDYGGYSAPAACSADLEQSTEKLCTLGDVRGRRLLMVYGDSHADMWLPAFDRLAKRAHMRLLVLGKPNCPASLVSISNPSGIGTPGGAYVACDEWHKWAVKTINALSPSILVISQDSTYNRPGPKGFTAAQWANGLRALFKEIPNPHIEKVYLGNIPLPLQSPPACLAAHVNHVQACSIPVTQAYRRFDQTEYAVTQSLHIRYIDPTPWFCSNVCTAVIGHYDVYMDRFHVSAAYATYLEKPLAHALFTPTPLATHFDFQVVSKLIQPSNGATVSGTSWLAATASVGSSPVARVEFELSGHGLANEPICPAGPSFIGWLCPWETARFANGRYVLRSVAYTATGRAIPSRPVRVTVRN